MATVERGRRFRMGEMNHGIPAAGTQGSRRRRPCGAPAGAWSWRRRNRRGRRPLGGFMVTEGFVVSNPVASATQRSSIAVAASPSDQLIGRVRSLRRRSPVDDRRSCRYRCQLALGASSHAKADGTVGELGRRESCVRYVDDRDRPLEPAVLVGPKLAGARRVRAVPSGCRSSPAIGAALRLDVEQIGEVGPRLFLEERTLFTVS